MRAAGESKTAVGATALKATTVEAEVSAAQVAVLEVTMELAVRAIVYVVEAEVLAWRKMVKLKTKKGIGLCWYV